MIHRRRRSGSVAAALALAVVAAGAAGAAAPSPTDAPSDPLEGPFADALLVGPRVAEGGGVPVPARLLVMRSPAVDENGVTRVALLERAGGESGSDADFDWPVMTEQALPTGLVGPVDGGFLLALGDDRFVVVSPGLDDGREATAVIGLTVYRHQVSAWARATLPLGVDAAGVADTDADGRPELVVLDRAGPCNGADIRVIDAADLHEVRHLSANGVGMVAGALGQFDARPGVDLAISATDCLGAGPPGDAILIQPLAGDPVIELTAPIASAAAPLLAADIDRDGRDDLIAGSQPGLSVRAAADAWQLRSLYWAATPLAASEDPGGGVWVAALDDPSGEAGSMRLRHVSLSAELEPVIDANSAATAIPSATDFTASVIGDASPSRASTGSWAGDVDGDGCPDLLVARLTLLCSSVGVIRTGPGWYATTPIGAYGEGHARHLLVAGTASWPPDGQWIAAPAPAGDASAEPRWRDAASSPFFISEVAVADLLYHVRFPVPSVAMGREQVSRDELGVTIGGSAGDRFFIRTIPLVGSADRGPLDSIAAFLGGFPTEPGIRVTRRIGIAPGGNSGARNGFIRLPLDAGVAAHQVSVVGVNDWGEVSTLTQARVEVDRIGPTLLVQAPFLSLPWPFVTRIEGIADPGAQVRIGDGESVEAARNGAFSIRTSLAPWPQTLDIRATDPAGNETVRPLTVVGGVDYRRLPWEIILGAGVLVAALLAALRSPGQLGRMASPPRRLAVAGPTFGLTGAPVPARSSVREAIWEEPWPGQAYDADGEPVPVIEDLV